MLKIEFENKKVEVTNVHIAYTRRDCVSRWCLNRIKPLFDRIFVKLDLNAGTDQHTNRVWAMHIQSPTVLNQAKTVLSQPYTGDEYLRF